MSSLEYPIIWPPLTDEIQPFRKYCKGLVLNAGSGKRELGLGERELNIDIVPDNEPDIIGDLHSIPLIDEAVDTIVSIAVLEHTRFPWMVVQEFYRILKPGGYGVIAVPFIQPQHACPDDYCRFTENGLVELSKHTGFKVIEITHVHHFGQTIAWLLWEYLRENMPQNPLVLRLWYWLIRQLSKGTFLASDSSNTHNTHYIVVQKPGQRQQSAETKALLNDKSATWFFPLLSCPNTRHALHHQDDHLVSEDGQFTYAIHAKIPTLLPHTDPRTWKTFVARRGEAQPAPVVKASVAAETAHSAEVASESQNQIPVGLSYRPELRGLSPRSFEVSFKAPFAEQLKQGNPSKIAFLATNEYEGLFRNGGVGTHYRTLSEQLIHNGWRVILFLCDYNLHYKYYPEYRGASPVPAVNHAFSTADLQEVLNLQPVHQAILNNFASNSKYWFDYQSFSCLLFTQAISNLFPDLPTYVEFHEMSGIGYHTIQAKRSGLLNSNCVIGVTMHSGHEWVYEANEWFSEEYPPSYQQACDYEQFSYENADLIFFPSYFLKEKVESYGWRTGDAKHMPYFVPILQDNASPVGFMGDTAVNSAVLNHPHGKVPVVFFGRLEMRKGIMTFVEAIKRLSPEIRSQIHVHFVGKVVRLHAGRFGDLESDRYVQRELEGKIPYTLHTEFYSHQANQFIRALKNPIVCLASHQENFPNTGLEMGQIPVSLVVSDTGGFRETLGFVNRKSGLYWFKPADPNAMSDMISKAFFNRPELPEVPDIAELEEINRQLWERKLKYIETACNQKVESITEAKRSKVTIGITCYNLGKYLMDCLMSVEAQTYDNLEVIVLDDASSDLETQQVIEQAKSIFQTYKFVRAETNLGLGSARNRLIGLAEGEYFLPLDADNRLLPFAIETFVQAMKHCQAEAVVSSMIVFGSDSYVGNTFRHSSLPTLLQANTAGDACSLFSTRLLRKFQHAERRDCSTQDWYILSAATATGAKVVHYPYPLYEYRLRSDSMIKEASFSKERYYLRQYLAQIPAAEWSPRQINMLMLAVQELQAQQEKCQSQVQQAQAQVQQAQAETQQVCAELEAVRQKLQKARGNARGTRESLEHTQVDLQQAKERIHAMETSKFWQIRKGWFKLKKVLNLPSNE